MSVETADQLESVAERQSTPEKPEAGLRPVFGSVERWLERRLDLLALAAVFCGFVLRIIAAAKTYLNPDEALHYLIINQNSPLDAYKVSLSNAHPPLIYLVIYFWHFLGRSELMLRMPSVIAGSAFCWVVFQWMKRVFGNSAGLIGVIVCAFSPALIALSAELRAYALLLVWVASALHFLARAFEETFPERQARYVWFFSIFLCLAILTHYSAIFLALALGLYVLARLADSRWTTRAIVTWIEGQAIALAICGLLYVTHISKIKTSIAAWSTMYDNNFYNPVGGDLLEFTATNTHGIFLFLFGHPWVTAIMLFSFLAAVIYLVGRDFARPDGGESLRRAGILLLMPFAAVWGASLAGIYPYTGTRHTAFLAPFAIAAASYLLSLVTRKKLLAGLLLAGILMAASSLSAGSLENGENPANENRDLMYSAVKYLKETVPQKDPILMDFQSSLHAYYYLCGPYNIAPKDPYQRDYFRFHCGGYTVYSLHLWKIIPGNLPTEFRKMAQASGLKPGDSVTVFQSGWGVNLGGELPKEDSRFRCLTPKMFGEKISVTSFLVGPDLLPAPPVECK